MHDDVACVRLRGAVPREYCLSQNIPRTQYRLSFISDLLETQLDPSTSGERRLSIEFSGDAIASWTPSNVKRATHVKTMFPSHSWSQNLLLWVVADIFKRDAGDLVPFHSVTRVCWILRTHPFRANWIIASRLL